MNVKNNSHTDLKIPTHSFRKKAISMNKKTKKIEFCHKEYITNDNVKIIEIMFLFCLRPG